LVIDGSATITIEISADGATAQYRMNLSGF